MSRLCPAEKGGSLRMAMDTLLQRPRRDTGRVFGERGFQRFELELELIEQRATALGAIAPKHEQIWAA